MNNYQRYRVPKTEEDRNKIKKEEEAKSYSSPKTDKENKNYNCCNIYAYFFYYNKYKH